MILNKNGMPYYVTGRKISRNTLRSKTKDKLIEYLCVAQHNYECVNESEYNIKLYARKLDQALDKACDFLEKSKFGTTCDEEYHKKCTENNSSNYCMHSRKMNKEEWRKYLIGKVEICE